MNFPALRGTRADRGLSAKGRERDVRVELVLLVRGDPHVLLGERRTSTDERILLGEQGNHRRAHDLQQLVSPHRKKSSRTHLESNRRLARIVLLVLVDDRPHTALGDISASRSIASRLEDLLGRVEAVSSPVGIGASLLRHRKDLSLDDRVVDSIDHRIEADAEDVCEKALVGKEIGKKGRAYAGGGEP